MKIGYSFWGFLGPGITDTPDGGRSHRRTLIDGLIAAGHEIVFLQRNRDLTEANDDLRGTYSWDATGFPLIDLLFLEWRWPIPGRNTTTCGTAGHTCDLHRQEQLLAYYTRYGTGTIVWDKDQQLPINDALRAHGAVTVCEPSLHPTPGSRRLLFPLADADLDDLDPARLVAGHRPWPMVYIGNQYDRDAALSTYFAPAAARHAHVVAGKWNTTQHWPHVNFIGRIPFAEVAGLYRSAVATVLLLPERYARRGQMTQRFFEAVLAGCLPLAPATIRSVEEFVPPELQVRDGTDVTRLVSELQHLDVAERAELLAGCIEKLELFRASRQLAALDTLLTAALKQPSGVAP